MKHEVTKIGWLSPASVYEEYTEACKCLGVAEERSLHLLEGVWQVAELSGDYDIFEQCIQGLIKLGGVNILRAMLCFQKLHQVPDEIMQMERSADKATQQLAGVYGIKWRMNAMMMYQRGCASTVSWASH